MNTNIQPLSKELQDVNRRTIAWCRSQISAFVGDTIKELPDYGRDHDVLVGSYVCGFLQGQLIKRGFLETWADGDEAKKALGWLIMSTICVAAVIGHRRMVYVQSQLPQMSNALPTDNIMKLDRAGGFDGMDLAEGTKPHNGGWLLHFLKMTVTSISIDHAAEQADLVLIKRNPISNFIYSNRKCLFFVIGFLIVLVVFG